MTARPAISVAMATYNGEKYLLEQLTSIAAQSRPPDELVISDDGSTDRTLDIARRFAETSPFPIHVLQNPERLGYSRNFETAVAQCKGDVIFLCDQDDVWFPDKIDTVRAEFEDEEIMVVLNGQLITSAELKHRGITMLDNARRLRKTSDSLIEGCCTAFRKSWGELLLPIPPEGEALIQRGDLSHDQWLNQLSLLLGVRVFVERPLQYFRRHGDNVTRWVGNNPKGVAVADLVRGRLNRPPVEAWLRRTQVLDLYEKWLSANRIALQRMGVDSVDHAMKELAVERSSHKSRAALVQLPVTRRIWRIWLLLASGGYRYFYGWKSALRDVSRSA